MPKRLACLLAALLLFSACASKNITPANNTDVSDPVSENVEPESVPVVSLLEQGILSEFSDNVRIIELPVQGSGWPMFCIWDDLLILYSTGNEESESYELEMTAISFADGSVAAKLSMPDINPIRVQVCGERLGIADTVSGKVLFLNGALEVTDSYDVAIENGDSVAFSTDGSILYRLSYDDGCSAIDIVSGDVTPFAENYSDAFFSNISNTYATVSGYESNVGVYSYFSINLENGAIESCASDFSIFDADRTENGWIYQLAVSSTVFVFGDSDDPLMYSPGNQTAQFSSDGSVLLISDMGDSTGEAIADAYFEAQEAAFSAEEVSGEEDSGEYETDDPYTDTEAYSAIEYSTLYTAYGTDGQYISSCEVASGDNYLITQPVLLADGSGAVMLRYDAFGADNAELVYWDLKAVSEGEDLVLRHYSSCLPPENSEQLLPDELYEYAETLSETYGVTIYIGEECSDTYSDYTVDYCGDYWQAVAALDQLSEALAAYPDGFFEQLYVGDYQMLEINLTGTLYSRWMPEDSNGFSSFVGFVERASDRYIMVMDCTQYALTGSFHHEIAHMIDERLAWDARQRDDAYFSEEGWNNANPDGFEYAWSYYYLPDSIYDMSYDDYFIDLYSRTFPTEDRARIWEYALTDDWVFSNKSALLDKLRYYSECIRDSFDTTGWPEYTTWELVLSQYCEYEPEGAVG